MNEYTYFILGAAAALFASFLLLRSGKGKRWDSESPRPIDFELSKRIFCNDDAEFVSSRLQASLAREFRNERTALAISWLLKVRQHANFAFRTHLHAARTNPELSSGEELRVGFDFGIFQLASSVLYVIIRLGGPSNAARLVEFLMELSNRLQNAAQRVLSGANTPTSAQFFQSPIARSDRRSQ